MKSLKKTLAILLTLCLLFGFAGCTDKAQGSEPAPQPQTVTVTDHLGNKVTLPSDIERIVVCDIYPMVSVLSVFFDSAEKIVGMAPPSMTAAKNSLLSELYPEILNAETGFIDGTSVNTEELLKLNPDVVFYSSGSTQLGEQLQQAGVAAVAISAGKWQYNAIETLNNWIALLGQMFPENDRATLVSDYSDKVYDRVQERVSGLTDEQRAKIFFLFQYSETAIATAGTQAFGEWWAEAVGAVNVGKELEGTNFSAVNMEQIYQWNPQKIFITNFNTATPDTLYQNSVGNYDWSAIDAVKNREVYKMPLGMYRSYTCGVDTPVTLLWIAKAVYPELFSDIDITAETRDYYKQVFDIELTDEQAQKIFAPVSAASAF